MLTSSDLYHRIDDIVDGAYLAFIFTLIGDNFLSVEQKRRLEALGLVIGRRPLIELLYILIRNRPENGYAHDAKLGYLLDSISSTGILPVLNDAQQATIDTGRAAMMEAIESTKAQIKKQIRQEVNEANREHRQHVAVRRIESVHAVKERRDALRDKLLKLLPAIMASAQDAFERSFTSTLTDTVNDVVVDAATAESLFTGVPPKDIRVYKKVVNDDRLCGWCDKFYRNLDGSPIIYTLAQLQANGSNYGKPKSEWKPVLGKTHVRCRCQLFHRPPQK